MPRYDRHDRYDRYDDDPYGHYDRYGHYARHGSNKLYVGRISSRTQIYELGELFSRYGRVRHVDLKGDFGFVEFEDPRDADDAIYNLDGREFNGSHIIVKFARGDPHSNRCFNCGIKGHWTHECQAGDWKNRCYRCGEKGHIERNCQNSRKDLKRGRSYLRSPSPRRGRGRSRSYGRSRRSYSHLRSPRSDNRGADREERLSRRPGYGHSPRYPPPRDAERNGSSYHGGSPRGDGAQVP